MNRRSGTIISLQSEHIDEASEVLGRAFERDPLMETLFPLDEGESRKALMRFACQVRIELSWPLLGYWNDEKIWGVAGISVERDPPWPDQLSTNYESLKRQIGPDGTERLEINSDIAERHRPHAPNIYLGVIGVDPDKQGFGIGRALLESIHQISDDHPTSTGVYLDTGNPGNVSFYEHMGYRIIQEESFADVVVWCLFRPDKEKELI